MNDFKLTKMMKWSNLSLLFFLVHTSAQAQKITLKAKARPFEEIIKAIRQQADYEVFIPKDYLKDTKPVTIDARDMPLGEFLRNITKNQPIDAKVEENTNTIILTRRPPAKANTATELNEKKQPHLVSGKVVTENGTPVVGANVEVSSDNLGATITDKDGTFQIKASIGDLIHVRYVGYAPQKTVVIDPAQRLILTLEQVVNQMEDVVVTGIFNKAKESYTGAVTTVTKEQIDANRGQNLLQTIKNIDPAFQIGINNNLGSNPNMIPDVTLRGRSSLPTSVEEFNEGVRTTVNTPLVIMDGFEISLTRLMDFNDEDIESINILKDASATAIYGSRGANGVIVIVRKRPKAGKLLIAPRIDVTAELPDLNTYNLLSGAEILALQYREGQYYSDYPPSQLSMLNTYNSRLKDVLEGVNTDWLHYPVRTGLSTKYSLRVEGGSDQFIWGANIAYNNTEGAMKGSDRKTFNGDLTLSYSYKNILFRNQLTVGLNKAIESPYGSFDTWVNMMPYYRPYDNDGNLVQYFPGFNEFNPLVGNPLYDATLNTLNHSKYTELINNFSLEWRISSPLRLVTRFGVSKRMTSSDIFLPANHSTFRTYTTEELYFRKGKYTYGTGENADYEGQATLSYTKTINDKHQIYAGLDYFLKQGNNYKYGFTAEGFPNNSRPVLINAVQYELNSRPSGDLATTRSLGITANANYTYDNRYFTDFSYRIDGSSQFGSKSRFAPFWSAGLGWNLHREDFFKESTVVNLLRLRGSYGLSGSQQFSPYQAQQMYTYFVGDKYLNRSGAYLMALGNENLKWQVTDQINAGMEITLWDSRVNASVDLYKKTTSNLLSARDLPYATGFTSYIDNVGEVKNTGYEASLSFNVIRNEIKKLNWTVGTRIAYNKNRITKLSEAIKAQTEQYRLQGADVSSLFFEGYDQNSIWAVRSIGIDPSSGAELFLDAEGKVTPTWSAANKVYAGISNPLYNGNLTSMLRYQNFTLNLNFGYRWGGQVYNQTLIDRVEVTRNMLRDRNMDSRVLDDRWSNPGDFTFFKAFSDEATRATTRFVMDEKVFELQSASLDYRIINNATLQKYNIQNVRIGLNMSDLLYFSTVRRERGTIYPYARRVGFYLSLTI